MSYGQVYLCKCKELSASLSVVNDDFLACPECGGLIPRKVLVDEDELIEIIGNLDGNSIIYTDYDSEPYIHDNGLKRIVKAIKNHLEGK